MTKSGDGWHRVTGDRMKLSLPSRDDDEDVWEVDTVVEFTLQRKVEDWKDLSQRTADDEIDWIVDDVRGAIEDELGNVADSYHDRPKNLGYSFIKPPTDATLTVLRWRYTEPNLLVEFRFVADNWEVHNALTENNALYEVKDLIFGWLEQTRESCTTPVGNLRWV